MTAWDALGDYLEEQGQPEWAAMVRESHGEGGAIATAPPESLEVTVPRQPEESGFLVGARRPIIVEARWPDGSIFAELRDSIRSPLFASPTAVIFEVGSLLLAIPASRAVGYKETRTIR